MTVVHSPLHHKWVFLLHGQMWVDFNRIVRILQFIQLEERKKKKKGFGINTSYTFTALEEDTCVSTCFTAHLLPTFFCD